jgi:hypothetical protein
MSADNFYFTEGNKVYMGFASDLHTFYEAEKDRLLEEHRLEVDRWFREQVKDGGPVHVADSPENAQRWAGREYSEYGVYWVDGEDR